MPATRHIANGVTALLMALAAQSGGRSAGAAELPDLPARPTCEDVLRVAELRSPALEAARRAEGAARAHVGRAGSLPDPRLSFTWFAEEVETRVGPQKSRLSVRQRLPWFGKLDLREDEARGLADAARARLEQQRLDLRRDVTDAWYDLYVLGRSLALTDETLSLLTALEDVVRERYRTGATGHAHLVRAQLELASVEDRRGSLADRVPAARARLNALLHRPPDAELPLPAALPVARAAPTREAVRAAVRRAAPRLRLRDHQAATAAAADRLARRERWPDWTVGLDWIATDDALNSDLTDSGKDPLLLSVAVDLPLFRGKHDGAVREAEERLAAARLVRAAEEDRLLAEAELHLYRWRDAERRLELHETTLLPKARESWRATLTAYQAGDETFGDLIATQRLVLELELERERLLAERGRGAAELERLTGVVRDEEESK